MKNVCLLVLILLASFATLAQDDVKENFLNKVEQASSDSAKAGALVELAEHIGPTDRKESITIYRKALQLFENIADTASIALTHKQIGNNYYFLDQYINALQYWAEAEAAYRAIGDAKGVANILSNMGAIYFDQSAYTKALELYLKALKIGEEENDTFRIGTVYLNIGAIYTDKQDRELALENYFQARALFEQIDYGEGLTLTSLNIAEIYISQKKYDAAMKYLESGLKNLVPSSSYVTTILASIGAVKLKTSGFEEGIQYLDSAYQRSYQANDLSELTSTLNKLGNAYRAHGDFETAIAYYEKAKQIQLDSEMWTIGLKQNSKALAELYDQNNDYRSAHENQKIFQQVQDSLFSFESDKKIDQLMFNFDLDKKDSEIALLVKDKMIQDDAVRRQKLIKNGFIAGFALVFLFAGIFLRQRNRIGKEKLQNEKLLLNILPEEVADELKAKGHSEAHLIDKVSVLFTDFKDFTSLSEKMTPKELVEDLHQCFSAFDNICDKYGIEKIKTIGDAYMAAGGLPSPNSTHAQDVVKAALEMAKVVERGKEKKIAENLPFFEVRIGVHTGPVVAGIVGIKKFQYDIWGDTVNTASRMESSSEVGQVNISEATYELIKNEEGFTFESRGEIQAKGMGKLEMYFVKSGKA